jgi:hypothetical protein
MTVGYLECMLVIAVIKDHSKPVCEWDGTVYPVSIKCNLNFTFKSNTCEVYSLKMHRKKFINTQVLPGYVNFKCGKHAN